MKATEKQQKAIDTNSRKVLISAAAGSGKTSVLSRRVKRLVAEGANVQDMLVMTFTNAAAAEMKQRIEKELYEEAQACEDERLFCQAEQVAMADISTFHSFCAKVVRQNYEMVDVAPNFRIMSDAQTDTMKRKCVRQVLDSLYEKEDEGVMRLLYRYCKRANDKVILDQVLRVYNYMRGKPNPYEWVYSSYNVPVEEQKKWIDEQADKIAAIEIQDVVLLFNKVVELSEQYSQVQADKDARTLVDMENVAKIIETEGLMVAKQKYEGYSFERASNKKIDESLKPIREIAKDIRDDAKKKFKKIFNQESLTDEEAVAEINHTREDVYSIVELVKLFEKEYISAKTDQNAVDYEDLQHKALKILRSGENLFDYKYVFVDEYQDTNQVQEEIISLLHNEQNSLFMVGDVKQSIYKFRLADPEIIRNKSKDLEKDDKGEIIAMNENFRSANEVVDCVNYVMENIMSENLGEVHYDEKEALIGNREGGEASILICEAEKDEKDSKNKRQADMIANHIRQIIAETKDSDNPIKPGDIAVLLRSRSELTYYLTNALFELGIFVNSTMEEEKDFAEVELFVNFLKLIHNRQDDICLISLLRSYMFNFTEEELAKIREHDKDAAYFFLAAESYAKQADDETARKLSDFYSRLKELKLLCNSTELKSFIRILAEKYSFIEYVGCTNGGEEKKQVLEAVLTRMEELIELNGNSLYLLLRELAEIKKEKGVYAKNENKSVEEQCVQLMTIHGSKGLEFPVVYVASLNKAFSAKETTNPFIMHGKYGLTADYYNEETRKKYSTGETTVIKDILIKESRSEELRMLYVAMTRARDRLYLTGAIDNKEGKETKWETLKGRYENASCMLDWIMAANISDGKIKVCYEEKEEQQIQPIEFDFEEYEKDVINGYEKEELLCLQKSIKVPAKLSVSAVKKQQSDKIVYYNDFKFEEEAKISGARLGTLVHSVMERLIRRGQNVDDAIAGMRENVLIDEKEEIALIENKNMMECFLQSDIYERIRRSEKVLYEQQFVLQVKNEEIGYPGDEKIAIQGILDLAFLEDGEWVLVDYKTDKVTEKNIDEVAKGYLIQANLYAKALEEITGVGVRHKYLYFLRMDKAVCV